VEKTSQVMGGSQGVNESAEPRTEEGVERTFGLRIRGKQTRKRTLKKQASTL